MIKSYRILPLLVIITLTMAGCSAFVRAEQPIHSVFMDLTEQVTFGQTFSSRYRGLMGISIYLKPSNHSAGTITIHLRSNSQSEEDIVRSKLSLEEMVSPDYYPFLFSTQKDSFNRDYYLQIEGDVVSSIRIGYAPGESYLQGAMYRNGSPQDQQLTFKLIYDPYQVVVGLILLAISWLGMILVSMFLFMIPGWALLGWLSPSWNSHHWGEKVALASGVSLAIYPLLFLLGYLLKVHLGAIYAWFSPLAGLIFILWRLRSRIRNRSNLSRVERKLTLPHFNPSQYWPDLALMVTLGLMIIARFWVIRNLSIPLWGDSYQHTLITQLLIDNRGIFNSWLPYADLGTFTYHFGFHSLAAVFEWITHQTTGQAILWVGQILNVIAVLTLYPLANKIGGNHWAGVGALLVGGLFTTMPMYYVNWGRYTQLAGQAILPVAIFFIWEAFESDKFHWGLVALGWILWAGLALTHYRVLLFAILFLFALFLVYVIKPGFRNRLWILLTTGIGAGLLFLPWFIHVFSGKILTTFQNQLSTSARDVSTWTQEYNTVGNLFTYLPAWIWILIPILICWGLWKRRGGILIISLWWIFLILAANPNRLGLPGEGALSNFAVFIAAYIPAGIIAGSALGWLFSLISRLDYIHQARTAILPGFFSLVALSGTWAAQQRINDLDLMNSMLFTRPDARASTWIQTNLPQDAHILVNSMPAYGNTLIVGTDGGWWLPLTAKRSTTLPPINYGTEQGPQPQYRTWINQLTFDINSKGIQNPQVIQDLVERGITHVYIGQRQGRVNNGGPTLNPQVLSESPYFQEIYHQDLVWIFSFKSP